MEDITTKTVHHSISCVYKANTSELGLFKGLHWAVYNEQFLAFLTFLINMSSGKSEYACKLEVSKIFVL